MIHERCTVVYIWGLTEEGCVGILYLGSGGLVGVAVELVTSPVRWRHQAVSPPPRQVVLL